MVLRPGDTLRGGQYEIIAVLGQGGFGITYKALDAHLKRYVVLKSQNEHLQHDPDYEKYVERFMKEGQIMAKLAAREMHPNLVKVFDLFSEPANYHYLVMEFIEGQNLFEAVKARGRLPEAEVIFMAKQIGSALQWMHDHQLVHRDVHPGNIMVCPDGKAVLIDLGGAKELVPASQSSKGIIGNKGFAPYEQIASSKDTRHPSTDIFGLAGSLYFAVTGSKPTESLVRKLYDGNLIPPQQLVIISESLNVMLMQGLELEAADRPQSILQFLDTVSNHNKIPRLSQSELFFILPKPINESSLQDRVEPPTGKENTSGIPWGALLGCVIAYTIVGMGVSIPTPQGTMWLGSRAGIVAALIVARAMAEAMAEGVTAVLAIAVAFAGAGAMALAGAGAGVIALAGAGAGVMALASARNLPETEAMAVTGKIAATAFLGAVFGTVAVLWQGSWELVNGYGWVFAGSWWGAWPLGLGVAVAVPARELRNRQGLEIILPTCAVVVGLAIGWWIYRAVHPA